MPALIKCGNCQTVYSPSFITQNKNVDGLIKEVSTPVYRCPVCGTINEQASSDNSKKILLD